MISWKPPLDNGGVEISNYIIEKRDVNRDIWTTVTSATTKTTCKVIRSEICCVVVQDSNGRGLLEFRDVTVLSPFTDPQTNRGQGVHHENLC